MDGDFAKGRVVRYSTLRGIMSFLTGDDFRGYFFRGQSNSAWGLETGITRNLKRLHNQSLNPLAFENSLLGAFKREFSAHSTSRPDDADLLGWLAVMQHYRAPTRLLDWTMSPFIALYFAIQDLQDDVEGAVWLLNPVAAATTHLGPLTPTVWDHLQLWRGIVDDENEIVPNHRSFEELQNFRIRQAMINQTRWPLPVIPNWVDQRMLAQQSVFTLSGDLEFPMERLSFKREWKLEKLSPEARTALSDVPTSQIIHQVLIPGSLKREILVYLHFAGVTPASLFPGLDGLGQTISQLHLKVIPTADWLTGTSHGLPLRYPFPDSSE